MMKFGESALDPVDMTLDEINEVLDGLAQASALSPRQSLALKAARRYLEDLARKLRLRDNIFSRS